MTAFDDQIGGTHYKHMMIQPTEYIMANNLGWWRRERNKIHFSMEE